MSLTNQKLRSLKDKINEEAKQKLQETTTEEEKNKRSQKTENQ
mgnify:CR=1 FL=1